MNESEGGSDPIVSWSKLDWERRLGVRPGKYTQVSTVLSAIIAAVITAVVTGGLFATRDPWMDILFDRGAIPYAISFFFWWSLVILLFKLRKLQIQRKVLEFELIPQEPTFVVSADTSPFIMQRMRYFVDEPERFVLYKRILTALLSLQNLGRIYDVGEVLRSQSESDEASLETTYALIKGFLWGIPVLGFIGTVLGLSQAIGGFGDVLSAAKDVTAIAESLKSVTAGLATAFDTTLLALLCAIVLHFAATLLRKQEEEFLDDCTDYCQEHIIDRVKVVEATLAETE